MKKYIALLVALLVLPVASADWNYQTKEKVYDFRIVDYNNDGEEEIAVGSKFLHIVDFDGNLLKKFQYPGHAFDFSQVYLTPSFAVGGEDVGYLIDFHGNMKAQCTLEGTVKAALIRDLDSDARKELIFATEGRIYIFYRNGNPKHSREIPEIKKVACTDIDGDGNLEFIVAADKFYVLDKDLNDLWYCCADTNAFIVHDFNGDGVQEIVLAGKELRFYKQNGLLYWKHPLDDEAIDLFLADYDGDGTDEIVVLHKYRIAAYDKEGTQEWEYEYPSAKKFTTAYITDLDGNDVPEVILGLGNTLVVIENGERVAQHNTTYSNDEIFKIQANDLNDDGKKEILASSWRFLNVFTYEKEKPKEEEKEEKKEEKENIEAKKNQAQELYKQGGALFNQEKYAEAKEKFTQAKALYEEIGNTEMVQVCDTFIAKAYKGINGDKYFSQAKQKAQEENYEGAIQAYEQARKFYKDINQEKANLCTEKIKELQEKQKMAGILGYIPLIVFIVGIAAVAIYTARMAMKKQ